MRSFSPVVALTAWGWMRSRVLEVHMIVRKVLADATRRGLVARNVASEAEALKRRRPKSQVRAWTALQLSAFLDAAETHRLYAAFWLDARRSIDLDTRTLDVLEAWRTRLGNGLGRPGRGTDYLFPTPSGHPTHPDLFTGAFERVVSRIDLPQLRLHDLRHTHATLLLKAGVPIKMVSERR